MCSGVLEGGVEFGLTLKKLGYVLRCRQLEDDLKVVLTDNQLVDLAALCEDSDGSTYSGEFLCKCHISIEEPEASETDYMGRVQW